MSTQIMSACWKLQMPPTAKAVLISLADNANDHGECWPSLTTIAERTCFGRTAVIEAIKWLESVGLVKADRSDRYRTFYVLTPANFDPEKLVRQNNQSGKRTSSSDGELVRQADNEVRETDDEVRQADTNRQEPSRTVSKATKKQRADALPCPDDVNPQTWSDWLALRKAKKAPVTETVVKQARSESGKAGMTFDAFLAVWCARGSQGLQADWLKPNERAGPALTRVSPTSSPPSKTLSAIQQLQGMKHGNQLDSRRNSGRPEPAALLESGSDAGSGHDRWDGDGLASGDYR
ncbi:helix-turn-helix domain-containing protein [Stenotrophomonas humi]|uniref:helix-turn-helix domain-containing protein n=1 Tax=Stenotrophomonas humi TaxID=405444 RepID=UPI0009F82EEF|nr:helix-turn-helix domain-containing protein [Stenotrophomonas humi]